MIRYHNTTHDGRAFDPLTVQMVWEKGTAVPGSDPRLYRKDRCGKLIARNEYGMTTYMGWEIDHDRPVAQGGQSVLSNLQPLQWQNNRHKSDNWPYWSCLLRN